MRAKIVTLKRAKRLRREMTLPEVVMWSHLRGDKFAGVRFRRQHPIGVYILDFYCAERRLAIEIDGESHAGAQTRLHDAARDAWLVATGIRVLRCLARDVLDDDTLAGVLAAIRDAAAPSTPSGSPSPAKRRGRIGTHEQTEPS